MAGSWARGGRIGIVGGGQLGRMMAMEARRLGYRTCVLDPDPLGPAAQVADAVVAGSLADASAMRRLAGEVDVATYEFENIDAEAVEALAERVPVYPSPTVLRIAQHRIQEKTALKALGAPVPKFQGVNRPEDLDEAMAAVGFPLVMKTATGGYDGKGQGIVRDRAEAALLYKRLAEGGRPVILEEWIDLATEVSVICARAADGAVRTYVTTENRHRNGILDVSTAPAAIDPALDRQAQDLARQIAAGLDVVGVLAVEMFVARNGRLLVNELAPRPHNSGHHTLESCPTSQFEQLIRIVAGLPLGDTAPYRAAAMANLLGDLWVDGRSPNFVAALAVPGVRLHLYGKAEPRPGRKMGHVTCLAETAREARARVLQARDALSAWRAQ
jgi:5-(carboxyamino)imidazole ribonucleotide synthase